MARRGWTRALDDYAAHPPSPWRKLGAVLLWVVLPVALWDKRGPLVGLIAVAVYGAVFLLPAFRYRATDAWSRRHPALDASLVVPLLVLALAYVTELSIGACVLIGVAAGAVIVPVNVRGAAANR